MRFAPLSLLVIAALIGTPAAVAFADPAPVATSSRSASPATTTAVVSDAVRYAAREAKDTAVTKFHGGSEVLVIGGGTLTLLLVLLLVLIIF